MDLLTKVWTRSMTLARSLPPTARVAIGALVLAALIGWGYLQSDPFGTRYDYLLGGRGFSDEEIDGIQTAFAQAGLNDWQLEGNRVRLPRTERHAYLAALADHQAMPETFGSAWERMLDSQNLFESSKVRQLRQRHAMQKELSLVVSRMAGIDLATVKYDEVDLGGFPVEKRKTAMVAASASGSLPLDDDQVRSIRDLVAGAIAGLEAEDVTVTDLGSGRTYRGDAMPSRNQPGRSSLVEKERFEDDWRRRISEMLTIYPGVVVAVNAEWNTSPSEPAAARQTTEELADSGGAGHPSSSAPLGDFLPTPLPFINNTSSGPTGPTGPAGLARSAMAPPADHPGLSSADRRTDHAPNHVTASVAVPRSYLLQVLRQRSQYTDAAAESRPSAEQLRQLEADVHATIERQVLAMLPATVQGQAAVPRVVVSTYDDVPPAPANLFAELPSLETSRQWLARNWPLPAVAMAGLAGFAVLRFLFGRRRTPLPPLRSASPDDQEWRDDPSDPTTGGPLAADVDVSDEAGGRFAAEQDRPSGDGPWAGGETSAAGSGSLHEQLAALVHRDPDAAAGVLRDWIGEAA